MTAGAEGHLSPQLVLVLGSGVQPPSSRVKALCFGQIRKSEALKTHIHKAFRRLSFILLKEKHFPLGHDAELHSVSTCRYREVPLPPDWRLDLAVSGDTGGLGLPVPTVAPLRGLKARADGLSRRLWTPSRAACRPLSVLPSLPLCLSLSLSFSQLPPEAQLQKPCVWLKLLWNARTPEAGCRPPHRKSSPCYITPHKIFPSTFDPSCGAGEDS